jgi:hypothetical protein
MTPTEPTTTTDDSLRATRRVDREGFQPITPPVEHEHEQEQAQEKEPTPYNGGMPDDDASKKVR